MLNCTKLFFIGIALIAVSAYAYADQIPKCIFYGEGSLKNIESTPCWYEASDNNWQIQDGPMGMKDATLYNSQTKEKLVCYYDYVCSWSNQEDNKYNCQCSK